MHRLGTFPERSLDIDVIFDLMIHDLDLLLTRRCESRWSRSRRSACNVLTPRIDIANARLRFAYGCIANVTASRISRDRVRKVRFFQRDCVRVDRLRGAGGGDVSAGAAAQRACRRSTAASWTVAGEEPLKRELEDFVAAVRDQPRAGGVRTGRPRRAGAGDDGSLRRWSARS